MKFQRFKRGSVVMVEFSPSMGSEIKGKHLAIVLTKNDSPNNGVLTVIPLSSKNKPYYVPIGVVLRAKCKNVANKMQKIGFKKRHFKRLLNAK